MALPIAAATVPKNLTIRILRPQNRIAFGAVSRAFPAYNRHFDPVFTHLTDHAPVKRLPKTLTFTAIRGHFADSCSRRSPPPEFPHLSHLGIDEPHQQHTDGQVETQSHSRKPSPQVPECTEIRQKRHPCPVKPHLRFPFSPDLTHQWGKRAKNKAGIAPQRASRKRSPYPLQNLEPTFTHGRAIQGIQVPQTLTFASTSLWGSFLNPLTLCPGPAHRGPRTSSLDNPARPHHLSRKASPYQAGSLAR